MAHRCWMINRNGKQCRCFIDTERMGSQRGSQIPCYVYVCANHEKALLRGSQFVDRLGRRWEQERPGARVLVWVYPGKDG